MNKPLIRHCKNCIYHEDTVISMFNVICPVKYDYITTPRLSALLCRFYRQKGASNEPTKQI